MRDIEGDTGRWQRLEELKKKRRGLRFDLSIVQSEIDRLEKETSESFKKEIYKAAKPKTPFVDDDWFDDYMERRE